MCFITWLASTEAILTTENLRKQQFVLVFHVQGGKRRCRSSPSTSSSYLKFMMGNSLLVWHIMGDAKHGKVVEEKVHTRSKQAANNLAKD